MEPEAKYTLVGTVTLILLALMVMVLVWLGSTSGQRDNVPYKIYFARQSLEGLQLRSDVKMKGIRVGAVTGFRISSRRPGSVEVLVQVNGATPVLQNTRATVERHMLTGIASINLLNNTEDSPALTEAPADEYLPVIAEGDPDYQVSESMAQIARRADETMQRINQVLSGENQLALNEILVNLRGISAKFDRSLAGLDRTVLAMGGAADEVRAMSAGISSDARKLTQRYDALGEESAAAVKEIAGTIRRIGTDVATLSNRTDALLADGNIELRVTARELRATADALGVAARRFGDPGRVLFGPARGSMGPGESAK